MFCEIDFLDKDVKMTVFDYDSSSENSIERDLISKLLLRDRCWKPYQTEIMTEILKNGGTFLDIGCHIGYFTVLASIMGCRTIAIDSNPNYLEHLSNTMVRNELENIEVKNITINDRTKRTDIIQTSIPIKLLKLSIQGNECLFLACFMSELRTKKIEYIIMEITPKYSKNYANYISKLFSFGYAMYDIGNSEQRTLEHNTNHLENLEEFTFIDENRLNIYLDNLDEGQTNFLFILQKKPQI